MECLNFLNCRKYTVTIRQSQRAINCQSRGKLLSLTPCSSTRKTAPGVCAKVAQACFNREFNDVQMISWRLNASAHIGLGLLILTPTFRIWNRFWKYSMAIFIGSMSVNGFNTIYYSIGFWYHFSVYATLFHTMLLNPKCWFVRGHLFYSYADIWLFKCGNNHFMS